MQQSKKETTAPETISHSSDFDLANLPPLTNLGRKDAFFGNLTSSKHGAILGDCIVRKDGIYDPLLEAGLLDPSHVCEVKDLSECRTVKDLGYGSGGVVKLMQHRESKRKYALKEMELSNGDNTVLQIRELKINKDNPPYEHVVNFYQAFYSNGKLSFLLEYMDGGSLADVMKARNKGIDEEKYLSEIARQALKGLIWLHKAKVIHRDIKPSNILLNRNGRVKIADFGVSKVLDHSADMAITGVGTEGYMSPERMSGSVPYGFSCDVWSLGLTLLECATGQYPYIRPNGARWLSTFDLVSAIVDGPEPEAGDEFSKEFRDFISKCLQKNPKNRAKLPELLSHEFIARHTEAINIGELLPQDEV